MSVSDLAKLCCFGGLAFLGGSAISCAPAILPGPGTSIVPLGEEQEQVPAPGESLPPVEDRVISFCEMESIEEGREFQVSAIYYSGFEDSVFLDRNLCMTNRFWVEFLPSSAEGNSRRLLPRLKHGRATLGVFRGFYRCDGPYGHEDAFKCQFNVSAVEKVIGAVAPPKAPRDSAFSSG